jgi:beta-N-acetylhexosaminidase
MEALNVGQLFVIGLIGPTLTKKEAEFIVKNDIGGVVLFERNLQGPLELHKLCTDLYNLKERLPSRKPPFVAIDMEGGRIHRLKEPFTQWPSAKQVAELGSTAAAFKSAQMMGAELHAIGLNMNFSPCMDILTNKKNLLIGDRSYGSDPEEVAKMASAVVRGFIKAGVIPCAKHFPGHGNTIIDSHDELPVENITLEELEKRELVPFKKAFKARMDLVMTAHILYKKIDSKLPATLSPAIIKDLLKTKMRYRGLVLSDDLDMKALSKNFKKEEIPVLALKAGCDMLMYCHDFDLPGIALQAVRKAIKAGEIDTDQIKDSLEKVFDLKKEVLVAAAPMPLMDASKLVGNPEHKKLAAAIASGKLPKDLGAT